VDRAASLRCRRGGSAGLDRRQFIVQPAPVQVVVHVELPRHCCTQPPPAHVKLQIAP
jgi:hypothetical protein